MNESPLESPRPSGLTVILLMALALVPYFVNLGTPPLWDANEPLYAERPKEILEWEEGDFLAPTWNGKPYFAHAPLSAWVTVPFYMWFGANEFGERLPMALAAALIVLATFSLGRRAGGRRTALFAALIVAATPRFWLFSRQLAGDVYLVAFLTWALALALPVVAGDTTALRRLRWANVLVGIGFLAKGPVILVLYGGGLFLAWLWAKPRAPLLSLRPVRGLLLILCVGAPWFVYMALRYPDFLGEHFGHYTFGRVVGNIGNRGPMWYLVALLGDAQPWITVLPFGVVSALRRDRRLATLLPIAVIGWTIVFFTLSAGKRNVYMLPLYPLLAVAAAPMAAAVWDGAYRWSARLGGLAASFGCLMAALCLVLLARNVPRLEPEIYWPVGLFGLMAIPMAVGGIRRRGRLVTAGAIATLLGAQLAVALAFPALARFRPIPRMADRIRVEQDAENPEPAIIYRAAIHSLNFYLGRATRVAGDGELLEILGKRRTAYVLCYERRLDLAPFAEDPTRRRGLYHEIPGAKFDELERGPLLGFRFNRSVLGMGGPATQDLLLLKVTLPEDFPGAGDVDPQGGTGDSR